MRKHYPRMLALVFVLLLMSGLWATATAVTDPPPPNGSEGPSRRSSQLPAEAPSPLAPKVANTLPLLEGSICFQSDRDNSDYEEIYRMYADGSGQTRLTNNAVEDYTCTWSPDGSQIVFVSERDGNPEVYVMNAYGDHQKRLTSYGGTDVYPEWSPDGSKIVFASDRDGDLEIYVMNKDGAGVTQLTFNTSNDSHPSWSPNGSSIAFSSDRDGVLTEIYRMNADGSAQTRLTYDAVDDWYPQWSPDSSKILFYYRPSDISEDSEVWRMNADGSGLVQLTNTAGQNWAAVYSPDGRSIAFSSLRDGDREIYVMNADGSGQTDITNRHSSSDLAPSWIGSLPAIGPSRTITLTETGFTPDALTVPVGTQVIWYNATSQTHILQSGSTSVMIFLPLVMRDAQGMGVSALTARTIDPGRTTGAWWERTLGGGESFRATLEPGGTFAHLFATEGDYPYHLETSPYSAGLVTVLSKKAYCSSQDAITIDSLEAARAALEAGATEVSLSPAGCVLYSRTMSGPTVTHEELTVSDWTMETWDHTITQSLGLRDADLDGFFEWRSTVDRGPLVTDGRVQATLYTTDTQWLVRRETYTRLSEETMHVLWEEDTEGGGWLTTVANLEASTTDIYSRTIYPRTPTTTWTLAGGEPLGQASPAGACSSDKLNLILQRLAEGVQQGVACMYQHGRPDLAVKMTQNYATRQFMISCSSCPDQAQIAVWPDPTMPVNLTICDAFFASDANWQRSTLFHELEHLSEPPHDPTVENQAGDKNWEVDPVYACESMCFNGAATKCSCATCLRTTVCSSRCSAHGECNPQLGAKCLCTSRQKWYKTFAQCAVDCPTGLACFWATCKNYDVSCP